MTAPARYLAELIAPDGEHELRVFEASQLTTFLARNIEHEHYSWNEDYEVVRLFRYDSGTLTPLTVHSTGEDRDHDDWLYWDYEVCAADAMHADGGHVAEVAFTVRIDGRA